MTQPVLDPTDMISRVAKALTDHDIDGLLCFYQPDAVLIRPDGSEASGLDEIRAEYESYIHHVISMNAQVTWCHVSGDTAAVRGAFEISLKRRDGSTITVKGEPIEVLKRDEKGAWRYMIDHGFGANATDH